MMANSATTASSKTVLITGVSKGLGRALALELANLGHTIIGCSRDQNRLDSLQSELSALPNSNSNNNNNHLLLNVDVSLNSSVEEMARTVVHKNGVIPDIIVNNAAVINISGKMWEIPVEEFDRVIDINIKGTANVIRHFIPHMIPKNQGIVVNFSSLYGRMGAAQFSSYSSSKWGIEGLTKSIAKEIPNGMAIVALDPGIIYTDMLISCFGNLASQYQNSQQWALKAASMILKLTNADNGASLTVADPGVMPDEFS